MDINRMNQLGITSQLPWVDHPYYLGGQLHRTQRRSNQFDGSYDHGWASQVVGAPGTSALPASSLGGDVPGALGVMQMSGYPGLGTAPGFGPVPFEEDDDDERRKRARRGFAPYATTRDDLASFGKRMTNSSTEDMRDAQDSAYAAPHMKSALFRAGAKAETAEMDKWNFTRSSVPQYETDVAEKREQEEVEEEPEEVQAEGIGKRSFGFGKDSK